MWAASGWAKKDERCVFQMPPGGKLPVFRGCYRHVGGNPASGLLACRVTDGGNLLSAPERQTGLENNIGIAACVYHPNGHQSTSEYFGCHAAFLPRKQAIHTGGPTLRRSNCLYVHGDDALVRLLQQGADQRQIYLLVRQSNSVHITAFGNGVPYGAEFHS